MAPSIDQIIEGLQKTKGFRDYGAIRFKGSGKEGTVFGASYKVLGLDRNGFYLLRDTMGQELHVSPRTDAFLGAEVLKKQASRFKERL